MSQRCSSCELKGEGNRPMIRDLALFPFLDQVEGIWLRGHVWLQSNLNFTSAPGPLARDRAHLEKELL